MARVRGRYPGLEVTKDDIWHYLYGVMHAPDWRERYRHDLQRSLPRVPLADDFGAFRRAGEELMNLHIGYETCPEHPDAVCEVDGDPDQGEHPDPEVYRLGGRLRWGRSPDDPGTDDWSVLLVNDRCRLVGIPRQAHEYEVSGRSPLRWAVDGLAVKTDRESGAVDDPNGWHRWADHPFELIRHLRRLAYVGARSAEIIAGLPPSLPAVDDDGIGTDEEHKAELETALRGFAGDDGIGTDEEHEAELETALRGFADDDGIGTDEEHEAELETALRGFAGDDDGIGTDEEG